MNMLSYDPGSVCVGWCCWQHGDIWAVGLIELAEPDRIDQLCRELAVLDAGLREADVAPDLVIIEQARGYMQYGRRHNTRSLGRYFEATGALRGWWLGRGVPVVMQPADRSAGAKTAHRLEAESLGVDLSRWPRGKAEHVADAVSIGRSWIRSAYVRRAKHEQAAD